jgi:hypothetical protein
MFFTRPSTPSTPRALSSPRRASATQLLPSSRASSPSGSRASTARTRSTQLRAVCFLLIGTALFVWTSSSSPGEGAVKDAQRRAEGTRRRRSEQVTFGAGGSCEKQGWLTSEGFNDTHRLVVRVRPSTSPSARRPTIAEPALANPDNTLLSQSFDARLTEHLPNLFEYPSMPISASLDAPALSAAITPPSDCLAPSSTHYLPLHPPSNALAFSSSPDIPPPHGPNLFFSLCTGPQRVIDYSPIWSHFLQPAVEGGQKPGCLVTDAMGVWDEEGKKRANEELKKMGSSCTMRESSRVSASAMVRGRGVQRADLLPPQKSGQRYEMRVLGLVKDAWLESERRRWQEGGDVVEWFIFGCVHSSFILSLLLLTLLSTATTTPGGPTSPSSAPFSPVTIPPRIGCSAPSLKRPRTSPITAGSRTEVLVSLFRGRLCGRCSLWVSQRIHRVVSNRADLTLLNSTVDRCAERFANVFGGDGLIVSTYSTFSAP